jgi:uncharacterized phiE125 gp8 family phage protein
MSLVDLVTAKLFCQISHGQEDDVLQVLIDAAEEYVQEETGLYLHDGDGTVTELLDGGGVELWPTKRPINSISSIQDAESEYAEVTDWKNTRIRILHASGGVKWANGIQRWRVAYDAGYGPEGAPAGIKHAVLDLVYRAYKSRGGKGHQSAAGHGYDWQGLDISDIAKRLRKYGMKARIG